MRPICDNAETLAKAGTDVWLWSDALGPRKNLHGRVPHGRVLHRRVPHGRVPRVRVPHRHVRHGHAPHGRAAQKVLQSRKHTLGAVFGAKSSAKSVTDLWGAM